MSQHDAEADLLLVNAETSLMAVAAAGHNPMLEQPLEFLDALRTVIGPTVAAR